MKILKLWIENKRRRRDENFEHGCRHDAGNGPVVSSPIGEQVDDGVLWRDECPSRKRPRPAASRARECARIHDDLDPGKEFTMIFNALDRVSKLDLTDEELSAYNINARLHALMADKRVKMSLRMLAQQYVDSHSAWGVSGDASVRSVERRVGIVEVRMMRAML